MRSIYTFETSCIFQNSITKGESLTLEGLYDRQFAISIDSLAGYIALELQKASRSSM